MNANSEMALVHLGPTGDCKDGTQVFKLLI
jgi:hypothetical protein